MEKTLKAVVKEIAMDKKISIAKLGAKLCNYGVTLDDVEACDIILDIIDRMLQSRDKVVIDLSGFDTLPDGIGYALCQVDLTRVKLLASDEVRKSMEWVYRFHRQMGTPIEAG